MATQQKQPEQDHFGKDAAKMRTNGASTVARMALIYRNLDRFEKDKTNEAQGWAYAGIEDIADKLRDMMGQVGLVMTPVNTVLHHERGQTARGSTQHHYLLERTWRIRCEQDDGVLVTTIGESADVGDKGANRAMTASRKYALVDAFCAGMGDDPDAKAPEETQHPAQAGPAPGHEKAIERKDELIKQYGAEALKEALREHDVKVREFMDDAVYEKVKQSLAAGAEPKQAKP